MEFFGGHQFQLIVSFVVIVGAAFVALVCDFLKGNNEQLRELAIELKFRQEHGMARAGAPVATAVPSTKSASREVSAPRAQAEGAKEERVRKAAVEKEATHEALQKAIERVAEKQSSAAEPEAVASPKSRRDSRVAREAEAAMDRGNEIVAVRPRRVKSEAVGAVAPAAVPDIRVQRKAAMRSRRDQNLTEAVVDSAPPQPVAVSNPLVKLEVVPEAPEPKLSTDQKNLLDEILAATVANTPAPAAALHREKGRGRTAVRADLFSAIESRVNRLEAVHSPSVSAVAFEGDQGAPTPAERLRRAIEATQNQTNAGASSSQVSAEFPAGLQDGFVLSKLVQNRKPVSGLVVSIGLGNSERKTGRIPEAVHTLIRSLLGSEDFGCQSSEDEFLLIFPNEHGAAAQRKLNSIAERLWDFQLRSMGSLSILFSWGGVEVNGESITEAMSSASERMHETQRSRKVASVGTHQPVFVLEPAQRMAV